MPALRVGWRLQGLPALRVGWRLQGLPTLQVGWRLQGLPALPGQDAGAGRLWLWPEGRAGEALAREEPLGAGALAPSGWAPPGAARGGGQRRARSGRQAAMTSRDSDRALLERVRK